MYAEACIAGLSLTTQHHVALSDVTTQNTMHEVHQALLLQFLEVLIRYVSSCAGNGVGVAHVHSHKRCTANIVGS